MMKTSISNLKGMDRFFVIALVVWIALQLSRAIAIPLINQIFAGAESNAWLYPAYLDLFAVVFALPLIWAIAKRRGLLTWALTQMYLTISIVDHVGNLVTTTLVGPPSIAEGMNPFLVPVVQTALDVLFLVLLFFPRYRNLFFSIKERFS